MMDKNKLDELNEAQQFFQEIPPVQLYAALGVVRFTVFLFIIIHHLKHRSANTILLTGLSGSGKTTLFYQLEDGSSRRGLCNINGTK